MIRLALRFVSGRFHATPWMHHVNEGVPEWPPSPWRLMRAAASVLHTRSVGIPVDIAFEALLKLSKAPSFILPPATTGHTRHYLSRNELERTATDLVLDSFVVVSPDSPVVVQWPVELTRKEREVLAAVFSRLPYIGRAESWCAAELLGERIGDAEGLCKPSDGTPAPGFEIVKVLCAAEGVTREDLERTTAAIQREGWLDPPGSRWVLYRRPSGSLRGVPPPRRAQPPRRARPTVADIVLGGAVLPLLTEGVPFAGRVRAALMKLHEAPSRNFSGKDADGERLDRQHDHAHFIPDARDRTKPHKITHLVVYCPAGLTESEQDAILALRRIHPFEPGGSEVAALCNGFGLLPDFEDGVPLFGRSRHWRSRTPFVSPRHPKRGGRHSLEEQVVEELRARGLPEPREVRVLPQGTRLDGRLRSGEFQLRRSAWRPWPTTPVASLDIEFGDPVAGPVLLGLESHYGLGQLVPSIVR